MKNLSGLSPEVVREILNHDKWKTLEKHRHQKEMLQMKMGITPGSEVYFGSDKEGAIDLDSVSKSAWEYCRTVQGGDSSPELMSYLVTASWCGKRLAKYPSARDSKDAIESLRTEFKTVSEKFTSQEIDECVKAVPDFDSRIISSQLETLYSSEKSRIIYSPLFKELLKSYPQVDPDEFEIFYRNHRQNFVESGIAYLRRRFKEIPPPELSDRIDWAQSNHQYLPAFLKRWQEDLRKIEERMKMPQRAWKESIS
jgi:hypothetical protein